MVYASSDAEMKMVLKTCFRTRDTLEPPFSNVTLFRRRSEQATTVSGY